MNSLLENKLIDEMKYDDNYSYILKDNSQFLSTDYKVLQFQENKSLLKCMKVHFNGRIQLFYLLEGKKPLTELIAELNEDVSLKIIRDIIRTVLDVKYNGFLSANSIDLSFEHIYADPETYEIALLYLPANLRFYEDDYFLEKKLRAELYKWISELVKFSDSEDVKNFYDKLTDRHTHLEGLLNIIMKKNSITDESEENQIIRSEIRKEKVKCIKLVSQNVHDTIVFSVLKKEFLIGKNAKQVDGVLNVSNLVSRIHCKINEGEKGYILTDLNSSNGTFLNRLRLKSNVPYKINDGDYITIANIIFKVSYS